MSQMPYTGPGKDPMRYNATDIREMMDVFRGGIFGGNQAQRAARPEDTMTPRFQIERSIPEYQIRGGPARPPQGRETTRFVEMGGQEFRLTNPIPVPQRPPQGGFNRGINPGGMYTGGRGGGFGGVFGGGMMPPPYSGGFGGGFGGGYGGFGGGFGRLPFQMPSMGYGNRFAGMQFSGPFARPMMPRNYGMGGGFPMPQPRYPMPQPRNPYPYFPMMGGGFGGGFARGYI